MVLLKVTAKGQITLRKEVLQHLGAKPGTMLEVDLLPNGSAAVRTPRRDSRDIEDFIGLFKHRTDRSFTIDDINEAIAAGWAGEVDY